MVSSFLQLPLILGMLVSGAVVWKADDWSFQGVGMKGVEALFFWAFWFGVLYVPSFTNPSVNQICGMLADRFAKWAQYWNIIEPLATIWAASSVANLTVHFTKTRANLPRKIAHALEIIMWIGVGMIFLSFMTGTS